MRLLVVEDDAETATALATALTAAGHLVDVAGTGAAALTLAAAHGFAVITLDRMLPDMDGLELLAALRGAGVEGPVLMISALGDLDQRIAGLRAGGDDYVIKPFDLAEVLVRIEVLGRRAGDRLSRLRIGPLAIDRIEHVVTVAGQPLDLLAMEYRLIDFLARHSGRPVSNRLLFENVWGYHFDPDANVIAVHVARLRRKLEAAGGPVRIITVKGQGYQLDVG